MGTPKTTPLGRSIDHALSELETVTDEIRVKLHLANLDATATWNDKLQPQLFHARKHAREAKAASKAAIDDAVMAFKEFAAAIRGFSIQGEEVMRARNFSKLGGRARHPVLDGGDAFVPDFRHGFVELEDGDAEAFGEEFILAATSAEAVSESARDELNDEELDGLTVEDSPDPSLS